MTYSVENSKSDEGSKIRWELVPFFRGRVLDMPSGNYKTFPHFIWADHRKQIGKIVPDVWIETQAKLDLFSSQSFDCVFSCHLLQHIEDYKLALREWWRVVKPGGYLCLYLPHKDLCPLEYGGRKAKHHLLPIDITKAMLESGRFDLIENQIRNEEDEFSFFQVYRKLEKNQALESWADQKPGKTAAVVRYGAFGDMIQASSIFPGLKAQGYHLTVYCSAAGYDVVKHDPHVDRFIIQDKDDVPPQFLSEFWNYTRKKYDKWVNLSESVECTLLAAADRVNHEWPDAVRAKYMDRNYIEWTHELAQVPPPYQPMFYSTVEEKAWARKTAERWGRRNIVWSLSGSSVHKTWPHLDLIIDRIINTYRDTHIVLVGDDLCRILQAGWDRYDERLDKWIDVHPQVHCKSDIWTIRQSMAFCEAADLIIGTETGLLNAAGSMNTPKIVTLSHSSKEMLTKHWQKVIALEQPAGVGCPKAPCRQLHFDWTHCMKHEETGTALCQYYIDPDMMWHAIVSVLGESQRKAA